MESVWQKGDAAPVSHFMNKAAFSALDGIKYSSRYPSLAPNLFFASCISLNTHEAVMEILRLDPYQSETQYLQAIFQID